MFDAHCDILHLARVYGHYLANNIVIIKIISFFRKLYNSRNVLFFIHFNLAVSLLFAILVFVLGIETASGNAVSVFWSNPHLSPSPFFFSSFSLWDHKLTLQVACAFVAALLHYLFLSAFCWMLCEGIMLYLLLHIVLSNMAKKRWPFLLIGYRKYCYVVMAIIILLAILSLW